MTKTHLPIILITIIAGFFIFTNLSNQYLWQDEAETAVIGRNVLKYGYPRAYDGKNFVNPRLTVFNNMGYGKNEMWIYHPPVQFYVAALAFKLFGESTLSARILFALAGVINVILVYILALRLTKEKITADISAFITATALPFILLMRQCRYYSIAVLFVLLALIFYSVFLEKKRLGALFLMSMSLILLAYTVHGFFVPVAAAIAAHYFIFSFDKKTVVPFTMFLLVILAVVTPWFLISKSAAHAGTESLERIRKNFEFQIRMINKFIFPAAFFGICYAVRVVWKRKFSVNVTSSEKNALILIAMIVAASIATFCFAEQRNFRYLVYFIPLLAIVQGMILFRLFKFNKVLLALFLFISVATGVFNAGKPNFFLPKYFYEITHDYDGPIEGIVTFLKANARKGDTVKIIYGDQPLIFYTDLVVDNFWVYNLTRPAFADWIVFRRGWHELLENDFYTKMVGDNYIKHVINYPDITYENRPDDMGYHKFATDKEAEGVIIFEKKKYCETRSGWYW